MDSGNGSSSSSGNTLAIPSRTPTRSRSVSVIVRQAQEQTKQLLADGNGENGMTEAVADNNNSHHHHQYHHDNLDPAGDGSHSNNSNSSSSLQPPSTAAPARKRNTSIRAIGGLPAALALANGKSPAASPQLRPAKIAESYETTGAALASDTEPGIWEYNVPLDELAPPLSRATVLAPVVVDGSLANQLRGTAGGGGGGGGGSQQRQSDAVDRTEWLALAMRKHPDILELRERVRPLSRAESFARLFSPGLTEVKETLSRDVVYRLIMQHLHHDNMKQTCKALQEETHIAFEQPPDLDHSRLVALLRMAVKDVDRLFDLTLADKSVGAAAEVALSNHLFGLGFQEQDDGDVDIWDEPIDDDGGGNIRYEAAPPQHQPFPRADSGGGGGSGGEASSAVSLLSVVSTLAIEGVGLSVGPASTDHSQVPPPPPVEDNDRGLERITAASLNRIIIAVTSTRNVTAVKMVLTTYRSFTSPEKFLYKLLRRYHVPYDAIKYPDKSDWVLTVAREIQLRTCNLLKMYMDRHPDDFSDQMVRMVTIFVDVTLQGDGHHNLALKIGNQLEKLIRYRAGMKRLLENRTVFEAQEMIVMNKLLELCRPKASIRDQSDGFAGLLPTGAYSSAGASSSSAAAAAASSAAGMVSALQWYNATVDPAAWQESRVPKNIFSVALDIFDVDEEEIARQLTIIDHVYFCAMRPYELVNVNWTKRRHLSPNVLNIINRFNNLSLWTAARVLQENRIRERTAVLQKFLKIANCLRRLNNYNTLLAIVAGLNNSAVHRMRYTREEMQRKFIDMLEGMESLLSTDQSYKNYRTAIKAGFGNLDTPYLPYLGVHLTDLVFIDDGNKDMDNGLINFAKVKLVYNTVNQLLACQLRQFNIQPIHQVIMLLTNLPDPLSEDEMYRLSLLNEPRNVDRDAIL